MSNERVAGLYSGATRAGLLVGAPLAGALIGVTSPATVVLVDGISFAVAAAGIAAFVPASVQDGARADAEPTRWSFAGYLRELGEGFRFLRNERLLLGFAILAATTNLLDEALFTVLLPVWSRDRLHEATGVGLVSGAVGVGTLAGVVVGAWLGERLPRYGTFAIGYLIGGAPMFFVLAAVSTMPLAVAVSAVSGFFAGFLNPIIGAVSYERIPPHLRARVLGAIRASAWVGLPLGALLGGVVAEVGGLTGALVVTGLAMLAVTAMPALRPRIWRTMERVPERSHETSDAVSGV
jgi:predicted MFS family arabinose efflux permease